jgi:hypothetical protein
MTKLRLPLTVVLLLIVAACSRQDPVPPSPVSLLSVETRGGMCPNGPCGSLITIDTDGSIHQLKPTDLVLGQVPPQLFETLRIEIDRADFPMIESRLFTDTCPTAYDGQETIYTFHLPTGGEEIASCKVAIDPNHPLFLAVAAAITAAGR